MPAVLRTQEVQRDQAACELSDARFAALSNLFHAHVFCDGLYDLWEMQAESVEFCIPQLCSYYIRQTPPKVRCLSLEQRSAVAAVSSGEALL
jgi:hypothetical protein